MSTVKVAISIDDELLKGVDSLVKKRVFPSRSRAIAQAVREKLGRANHGRLARECAKLDPSYEQAMAEEGIAGDLAEWPEYLEATLSGRISTRSKDASRRAKDPFSF